MAANGTQSAIEAEKNSNTSSTVRLACNIRALKTKNGLLRLFELMMGLLLLVITLILRDVHYEYVSRMADPGMAEAAFCICLFTVLPVTFLLLVSYLASPLAAETLPKMLLELIHNVSAALCYLLTSLAMLIVVAEDDRASSIGGRIIAEITLGVGTAILYGINSYFSYISFKSA